MAPPFPTVPLTVDIIIEHPREERIVLIRRLHEPMGLAIPGGFVEPGEGGPTAAIREAKEETGLDVIIHEQFHTYSKPGRDKRGPVASIVYLAYSDGEPVGGDDAASAVWWDMTKGPAPFPDPSEMAFDHHQILVDYWNWRTLRVRPPADR
jgi:8-oxo-dGTP diphosphatase